jgi:hypothetical protein
MSVKSEAISGFFGCRETLLKTTALDMKTLSSFPKSQILAYFQQKMYEHKSRPLAPPRVFYRRVFRNIAVALMILSLSLLIGITGFCLFGNVSWIDGLHNSAMLLSGMGPVLQEYQYPDVPSKLFSSFYALFSGIVFITNIGLILTPVLHRIFHRLNLDEDATS